MLTSYFDSSGTNAEELYLVRAGFFGLSDHWKIFEQNWADLLAEPKYAKHLETRNGLRYAHARRMKSWPRALRETFYVHANDLLQRAGVWGMTTAIRYSDYAKVYGKWDHSGKDGIFGLSFRASVVYTCSSVVDHFDGQETVFVLERGDPKEGAAVTIHEATARDGKKWDEVKRQFPVGPLVIEDKEKWGALQASDMLAYNMLKHLQSDAGSNFGKKNLFSIPEIQLLLLNIKHHDHMLTQADLTSVVTAVSYELTRRKKFGAKKYRKKKTN